MDPKAAMVAIAALGLVAYFIRTVANLIGRKIDGGAPARLGVETEQRIVRIEQAVDAIAVEVERISEGQRFTNRLMAERNPAPLPAPKAAVQS
ncbi:MAG: hypothetical protein KGN74_15185 [Gemmatimonadota bacterium]|nr:hypothetical protein [Gemmatimonadota bacterium]